MNRTTVRAILQSITQQLITAPFSFIECKDERLNDYAVSPGSSFPIVHCYPPIWSQRGPMTNNAYFGKDYSIRLEFLKLLSPAEASHPIILQSSEDEMDAAASEFIVRLNDYVSFSPITQVSDVRCQSRDQQPASANILVGVDLTFILSTPDRFDYCEVSETTEIIIPPVPDRYVYFAAKLQYDYDLRQWTILDSLNIVSLVLDNTPIGPSGKNNVIKLKLKINATGPIISSSDTFNSEYFFPTSDLIFLYPVHDHESNHLYITFCTPVSIGPPLPLEISSRAVDATDLGQDTGFPAPFTAKFHIMGIARR